jgi:endogenous inhibitor of DNA gyrase (YacG/DUF329 family)
MEKAPFMTCPVCQKSSSGDFSPFCSKMCKNSDLLAWLNEKYRVPCEDPVQEKHDMDDE